MVVPMRRDGIPINTLLWRTFTPAIVVVAIALGALVYNRLYDTILDGFGRKLVTTSALTGALIDPADHDWLMAAWKPGADAEALEKSPAYLRNVLPMKRVKRELGLTYLYSQVVGGSKDIFYILDTSEGDDHSPIGSEDDMTPETLAGLKAATARDTVYVSPIEFQEQWGLLKTAAAPIRSVDGKINATAGADVNISVIQVATQNALFESALIGVASLLACALVTLLIMRRVAQPIERLKADALRIAAGDRTPPSRMSAPREAVKLRDALGELADHLVAAMRAARSQTLSHDRDRNQQLLESLLGDEGAAPTTTLVDNPDILVVWFGQMPRGAAALLERRGMRLLAERIAASPDLTADWAALAEAGGGSVLAISRRTATARLSGEAALTLRLGDAAPIRLAPDDSVVLKRGETLTAVLAYGDIRLDWETGR